MKNKSSSEKISDNKSPENRPRLVLKLIAGVLLLQAGIAGCLVAVDPSGAGELLAAVRMAGDGHTISALRKELTGDTTGGPLVGSYFMLNNHIGSNSVMTHAVDQAGATKGSHATTVSYLPYGEIDHALSPGQDLVTFKFTGQEFDAETGLYNFGARMYDPVTGRFLSADTVVPGNGADSQGLNRYMYVRGNPIQYNDPTGHQYEGGSGGGISGTGPVNSCVVNPASCMQGPPSGSGGSLADSGGGGSSPWDHVYISVNGETHSLGGMVRDLDAGLAATSRGLSAVNQGLASVTGLGNAHETLQGIHQALGPMGDNLPQAVPVGGMLGPGGPPGGKSIAPYSSDPYESGFVNRGIMRGRRVVSYNVERTASGFVYPRNPHLWTRGTSEATMNRLVSMGIGFVVGIPSASHTGDIGGRAGTPWGSEASMVTSYDGALIPTLWNLGHWNQPEMQMNSNAFVGGKLLGSSVFGGWSVLALGGLANLGFGYASDGNDITTFGVSDSTIGGHLDRAVDPLGSYPGGSSNSPGIYKSRKCDFSVNPPRC